mmetsp:Transcript_1762/g.4967  ORF Transcript_1762/g.4967 Transcript_1762/m.4967 type:complete len:203 (-) Transcript_1762:992-1600(-)
MFLLAIVSRGHGPTPDVKTVKWIGWWCRCRPRSCAVVYNVATLTQKSRVSRRWPGGGDLNSSLLGWTTSLDTLLLECSGRAWRRLSPEHLSSTTSTQHVSRLRPSSPTTSTPSPRGWPRRPTLRPRRSCSCPRVRPPTRWGSLMQRCSPAYRRCLQPQRQQLRPSSQHSNCSSPTFSTSPSPWHNALRQGPTRISYSIGTCV